MDAAARMVRVSVPATTANLGPGFDCVGAALTLPNRFSLRRVELDSAPELAIAVTGVEAERVSTGPDNLLYQAFCTFYQRLGQTPPKVEMAIELGVPLARGLGSSATAIVAGLVGANALAGFPWEKEAIAALATEIEGHPDNVVPALLGGCRLAASGLAEAGGEAGHEGSRQAWAIAELPWHPTVVPIVAIPAFELSTAKAREVLPLSYSRADAIFNTAHLGLLIRALESGEPNWLRAALQDRIHQPYRQSLIPGYATVEAAAIAAGAYGMVISGAGPTLLALGTAETAAAIALGMAQAWTGVEAIARVLAIDTVGTVVEVFH